MSEQLDAFLETIAYSELGQKLIDLSDRGFNILVGSTPSHLLLFPARSDGSPDYSQHPNILNKQLNSTAAGKWQLLHKYWLAYCDILNLNDFTPESQKLIAAQQIKECKALDLIEKGQITDALSLCAHIWASLPGSPYGQHTNSLADLEEYFVSRGGFIA